MHESAASMLTAWANFYVMVGGAAAALTGLMFVVITLVGRERVRQNPGGISIFSTPTVLHFGAVLFVSALWCVPWHTLVVPSMLLGFGSAYGIFHLVQALLTAQRLTTYRPDVEDWTWYTVLPIAAYAAMLAGSILLFRLPVDALFAIAAGVVCLIFAGIHNAWDVVTYITVGEGRADSDDQSD